PKSTFDLGRGVIRDLTIEGDRERIVLILKGDLGAGKTQFVKGVASFFGIDDITSPTFVVYYEYDLPENSGYRYLYHFDLYNIKNEKEFEHLGIDDILQKKAIICIEWGEKLGELFEKFKKNAFVELIEIEHVDEHTRKISI